MKYCSVIAVALVLLCANPGSCYFSKFLQRIQEQFLGSWRSMRDNYLRPRLIKELYFEGTPTFVTVVEGPTDEIEIAANIHNMSTGEVHLMRIQHVTEWLREGVPPVQSVIGSNIGWPNAVGKVEASILPGDQSDLWWASTVFTKEDEGRLVFLPLNGTRTELPTGNEVTHHPVRITKAADGNHWYYSEIKWVDMNQDGYPDIVTSRSRGMPENIKVSELVWFEHPGSQYSSSAVKGHWKPYPITHGPDVAFEVLRIPLPNGESKQVLIGAGYWDNKLYAVWTDESEEDWTDDEMIKERVIDNHGWFFDLQLVDVNADGRDDILVTTWSYRKKQGSVLAYEIPCDFIRGEWRKHILIDAAYVKEYASLASGGKVKAFHPLVRDGSIGRKKKPYILVSGDDDGHVYVLVPDSPKTNDWSYTKHTIFETGGGAVGAVDIADLDHDGFNEVTVPVVASNKLMVFSYRPGEIGPEYFVHEFRRGNNPRDPEEDLSA